MFQKSNGRKPMKSRLCFALCLLAVSPQLASAQAELTDTQKLGQRLFEQSCGVCHTRPTLVSGLYGPALSKDAAGGRADVVRDVISNGTPRWRGLNYPYDPPQTAATGPSLAIMRAPAAAPAPAVPQAAPRTDN